METHGEIELRSHEFEKSGPKPPRKTCGAVAYDALWDAPIFDYVLEEHSCGILSIEFCGHGMKTPYLLN